jgi:hypothetical protein
MQTVRTGAVAVSVSPGDRLFGTGAVSMMKPQVALYGTFWARLEANDAQTGVNPESRG